ncbi:hypothetical protein RDI58_001110 [Solanum bulbocastanum]|uniref:Uncharacterized protein n=1 Tax=Solanum bulbocastanum TaxID=147425 RepID=A0AAN8YPV4_SOLBU
MTLKGMNHSKTTTPTTRRHQRIQRDSHHLKRNIIGVFQII